MPILETDDLELPDLDSEVGEESGETPDWLSRNVEKAKSRFGRSDREPRRIGRKKNLTEPLADQIVFAGTFLSFVRPMTGLAVVDQAEDLAKALNDVAKTNDRLYRTLERLTTSGKYGKLVTATMPIAAAAYIETFPNDSGFLATQAVNVMERGLSESTMDKMVGLLEKAQQKGGRLHPVA